MKRGGREHDERAGGRPAEEAALGTPEPAAAEPPAAEAPALPEAAADLPAEPAPAVPDASDLRDRWLRAEAELQNYRRRAARDREEVRRSAEDSMLREWIGVIDDLDRAIGSAGSAGVEASWLAGLRLVAQRMLDLMARHGVRPLDPGGQPFDPAFHEALAEVEGPADVAPGTVVEVVQKGYARGDRALRPARVLVARGAMAAGPR